MKNQTKPLGAVPWQGVLAGLFVGLINGMLGAGGGMLAVPVLKQLGLNQQKAHASAVAVIFPLTALSCICYALLGRFSPSASLPYLLPGVAGALVGAWLLAKIPGQWLRRAFALFMIWAGVRMVLR